jgi:hypothetical protein
MQKSGPSSVLAPPRAFPNPELTGLSYWISISRIERSVNAFAPPASALVLSALARTSLSTLQRGAKEHAMGSWTAGFLGFTVIHIMRVVLHVLFFRAHRENRLDRVSIVSEMYKPSVTSFLLFAFCKK